MRSHGSLTAEFVALFRAGAGLDDDAERCLSAPLRGLLAAWRRGVPFSALSAGLVPAVLARLAFFDAVVADAVADGASQLVVLGAGFDRRAQRLGLTDQARVFLVDHPATAAVRAARLPDEVGTRVDVDFDRADFAAALLAAGFDPARRSVITWEGVSMYLPAAAVAETLDRAAALLGPEGRLVFDFVEPPARRALLIRLGSSGLGLVGEPLRWRASPGEVQAMLEARGFEGRVQWAPAVARRLGLGRAMRHHGFVEASRRPPADASAAQARQN